jgi:hypothetical protein
MDLNKRTLLERDSMLNGGMVEITEGELIAKLDSLGYEIDPDDSFEYTNTGNAIAYKARSVAIRHKASGLSFAHIHCDRSKLAELQKVRMGYFVFTSGRIWEL